MQPPRSPGRRTVLINTEPLHCADMIRRTKAVRINSQWTGRSRAILQPTDHDDGQRAHRVRRTLSHTPAWYAKQALKSHRNNAADGAPLPLPWDISAADRRVRLKLAPRSARTPSVATTAAQSDRPLRPCINRKADLPSTVLQ